MIINLNDDWRIRSDPSPMDRQTLTVPEAGKVLGIGRNSAYEAARRGQIPVIRLGRRLLVPVAALRRLLAQGHRETALGAAQDPNDSPRD